MKALPSRSPRPSPSKPQNLAGMSSTRPVTKTDIDDVTGQAIQALGLVFTEPRAAVRLADAALAKARTETARLEHVHAIHRQSRHASTRAATERGTAEAQPNKSGQLQGDTARRSPDPVAIGKALNKMRGATALARVLRDEVEALRALQYKPNRQPLTERDQP